MNGKLDVMVDIETTGTCHNAGILTIGAMILQPQVGIDRFFYIKLDPKHIEREGFIIQRHVMEWWDKQRKDVKDEAFSGLELPTVAFTSFAQWLNNIPEEYNIWGNAPSFDCSILKDYFDKLGIPCPWKYWNEMCYRTVKNMFPGIKIQKGNDAHSAIVDAHNQGRHLQEILNYLQVTGATR